MSEDITCEEVKKRLESGESFNFIDVREIWEHDEANIGAKCYPLNELPAFLNELEPLKSEEVVVHCRSGARSAKARKYLLSQGFTNVRNMLGGILAYQEL